MFATSNNAGDAAGQVNMPANASIAHADFDWFDYRGSD